MTHHIDPTLKSTHVKVYAALREAWVDYGWAPSQIEIRDACLLSVDTVRQALKELKRRGYITMPKHQVRSARPTDLERTIGNAPPDPWAELEPPKKFFRPEPRRTNR